MVRSLTAAQESDAGTPLPFRRLGRALPLCPGTSDVYFLRNLNGVVNFDAEVPHCAFQPLMAKQKLRRAQVARAAVYEGRLGTPQ